MLGRLWVSTLAVGVFAGGERRQHGCGHVFRDGVVFVCQFAQALQEPLVAVGRGGRVAGHVGLVGLSATRRSRVDEDRAKLGRSAHHRRFRVRRAGRGDGLR